MLSEKDTGKVHSSAEKSLATKEIYLNHFYTISLIEFNLSRFKKKKTTLNKCRLLTVVHLADKTLVLLDWSHVLKKKKRSRETKKKSDCGAQLITLSASNLDPTDLDAKTSVLFMSGHEIEI